MHLDFHAHCNSDDPELLRTYVENCERNETIAALSGGLHYGGHDFVPNEEVVRICKQYPHNLVPLAKIDLWDTPPDPAEARRYADMGVKGFKFIYPYYTYDHESYFPLYEEIEKLGLPVLFHTGGYRPSAADIRFRRPMVKNMAPINLDCIARSFQNLHIVMAHLGTEFFREIAVNLVKLHKNLYFDLAGSGAFLGVGADELLSYARSKVCPGMTSAEAFLGKMVLGSDSYITMPFIQSQAVNAYQQTLFRCCVSPEVTHNVLGGTVASWMGLDLPATSNVKGLTTPWDRTQLS